jgi:hypothetical protein
MAKRNFAWPSSATAIFQPELFAYRLTRCHNADFHDRFARVTYGQVKQNPGVREKAWQAQKALVTFLLKYCAVFATHIIATITDRRPTNSMIACLSPHLLLVVDDGTGDARQDMVFCLLPVRQLRPAF